MWPSGSCAELHQGNVQTLRFAWCVGTPVSTVALRELNSGVMPPAWNHSRQLVGRGASAFFHSVFQALNVVWVTMSRFSTQGLAWFLISDHCEFGSRGDQHCMKTGW